MTGVQFVASEIEDFGETGIGTGPLVALLYPARDGQCRRATASSPTRSASTGATARGCPPAVPPLHRYRLPAHRCPVGRHRTDGQRCAMTRLAMPVLPAHPGRCRARRMRATLIMSPLRLAVK